MDDNNKTMPTKCKLCDKPMSTTVVCDFCHSLNAPGVSDYYTLLGLERRFDIDLAQLQQKFLALTRHAHPDHHAKDTPDVQALALRISAGLNDAYRTLKEPSARASYLLELLGGKSSAQDKSVPDGFLGTIVMMQEELADAKASADEGELSRLRSVLQTQYEGLMKRIGGLFADYQEALSCEAVRTDLLREIRQQINAVSYVRKLLSQL